MDKEKVLELADYIEALPDEHFNQALQPNSSPCGCVAHHAFKMLGMRVFRADVGVVGELMELALPFDLNSRQAKFIYYGGCRREGVLGKLQNKAGAVKMLREAAEIGEIPLWW